MGLFYKDKQDAKLDKEQLEVLLKTVNGAKSSLAVGECINYQLSGSRANIITWGDKERKLYAFHVRFKSMRKWNFFKKSIPNDLAIVTQDGDDEGVLKLLRLPQDDLEAAWLRKACGLRQTQLAPEGQRFTTRGQTPLSGDNFNGNE